MSNLVLKVKEGLIEGQIDKHGVREFKGIPYAKAPVGKHRFGLPVLHEGWEGIRECKEFGCKAYQFDLSDMPLYGKEFYSGKDVEESEDCLFLNVWAPDNDKKNLPVLVYIHGGAFNHGHGGEIEFEGYSFAKNDCICVTINYRLGSLGFFYHEDLEQENPHHAAGNYGLHDQIMALRWVKENIEVFNGNPNNVTLAGQSAGCMSVQCLVNSPLAKGLVHKAILQSGGGIPGFASNKSKQTQQQKSLELMKKLNVETIEQLRELDAKVVADAGLAMEGEGLCWDPCVDGFLLEKSVVEATSDGTIMDIPYMIGSTKDEMGGPTASLLHESAKTFAKLMNETHQNKAYVYHFVHDLPSDDAGSFHSCELWYEFNTLESCWREKTQEDYDIADKFHYSVIEFMKDGDPKHGWKPYLDDADVMKF